MIMFWFSAWKSMHICSSPPFFRTNKMGWLYCEYDGCIHPLAKRSSIYCFALSSSVWLNRYYLWFGIGRVGSSSSIRCWIARGCGVDGSSNTSGNSSRSWSHFVDVNAASGFCVYVNSYICVEVCVWVFVAVFVSIVCAHSIAGEYADYAAGWPALSQSTASTALTCTVNNLHHAADDRRMFCIY